MRTRQARWVRTTKFFSLLNTRAWYRRTRCFTDVGFTISEATDDSNALFVGFRIGTDHNLRISSQRIGIHRIDKDGLWAATQFWHLRERTRAQRGPETGCYEVLLNIACTQSCKLVSWITVEGFFVVAIDFDNDGEENTAFAAIDGFYHTRGRSDVLNAIGLLVGKYHLAFLDSITFLNSHRWLHTNEVRTDYGYLSNLRTVRNFLFRATGDW